MQIIPKQCKRQSMPVKDIPAIRPLIEKIAILCNTPLGRYPGAIAISHCQVDHENPERFFVLANGSVVINPKIIDRQALITRKEGCYSHAFREEKKVNRYDWIKVKYKTLDDNGKTHKKEETLTGLMAHVFQHEIDHFNGKSIYS